MAKPTTESRKSKDILRALMDPSRPDAVPWSSGDLRAILQHQLAALLVSEAERFAETSGRSPAEVSSMLEPLKAATFGQLLASASPCLDALELVKGFAKASLSTDGDLPRDVARVLYVATILRGRSAGHPDISSLDEASLGREARRCLTFGWLPEDVRSLFRVEA